MSLTKKSFLIVTMFPSVTYKHVPLSQIQSIQVQAAITF